MFSSTIVIMGEIRSMFDSIGIQKKDKPLVVIKTESVSRIAFFNSCIDVMIGMTGAGEITVVSADSEDPSGSISKLVEKETVFVKIVGIIDIKQEITRLNKLIKKTEASLEGCYKKLSGKAAEKMPESVKEEMHAKVALYKEHIEGYGQSIVTLQKLE